MTHTVRYETDPAHTFVTFGVRHFKTSTVFGRFDKVEGHIDVDTIRRSDWGMTWGLDIGVPDEAELAIQIEAVRQ